MRRSKFAAGAFLCVSFTGVMSAGQSAHADLVADSQATLEMRNFYFDRDFRQPGGSLSNGQSQAREWGQGFILRMQSGYTEGTVGFGIDAIGMLGVKLDSATERSGTGLFPSESDGSSVDDYSKLGVAAKARASQTTVSAGALMFRKPVLQASDSRLLPQMFRGALLESREIDGLSLQAARVTRYMGLDSSNWDRLTSRFGGKSDKFILMGGDYSLSTTSTMGLHYGELDGVYRQVVGTFVGTLNLGGDQSIKTDVRLAKGDEADDFRPIDNKAVGVMSTYRIGGHSFGVGYQKMIGDDAYPYVLNTDPYLVNFIQILQFSNAGERSVQLRYDFDFASMGVPGLSFMTRYVKGDRVDLPSGDEGREWERNTDIAYVIQSGYFRSLAFKWRNATVRSSFGNDIDENRIIVSYPLNLF
ncbi:OprD family porin [Pseudomonas sp. BN414]|uniref:OprD family porin n=1 Tax=Pseudomonas sp. BN414 TaxID=2567888 RepID=UPI00245608A0|nr:OprD family porin [Pseudomonas sp. BN414]MDH4567051.1 OprD family porin [Pseudomonas sp. BN414]